LGGLKQYELVSEQLIKNEELEKIAQDIVNLRKEVFTVFSASSGMGKTQTALALLSYFQQKGIPAFYMLHTKPGVKSQIIYQYFERISFFLGHCLHKDLAALKEEWKDQQLSANSSSEFISYLSTDKLSHHELYLFGFVKAILNYFKDSNTNLPSAAKGLKRYVICLN
jgi:hypothetical protein